MHPGIQMKLREELKDIRSKNNGNWSIEDIENAKYLDMVICGKLPSILFLI